MKYNHPAKILILPFVTFGIYSIVWCVNNKRGMTAMGAQIPPAWFMFIPIANLVWYWKYCKGVATVTGNTLSAGATLCLMAFLGTIGMAVTQDKLNKFAVKAEAA